ncbi:Predicted acetyltransferase [Paenibacillus uliginis N3/975]|uniref:Predicted acetyltransferase n=1 Tax=Paenibacillus uliginis N3/975 TaxID=1313296 RepID=A0A1X7H792_9BACL|nr:GNAT family N-acetyltransferase [Paenibacillus uliginis]SMF80758.1 Predicted acetyltransferase [Paenibacillus uliginis N3/975]
MDFIIREAKQDDYKGSFMKSIDLNDDQLMQIQASTLYVLDETGRMIRINEPGETDSPALFIGKTHNSMHTYISDRLPEAIAEELNDHIKSSINIVMLCEIIGKYSAVKNVWIGPAYAYLHSIPPSMEDEQVMVINENNAHMLSRHFDHLTLKLTEHLPIVGYVWDGQVVSLCCSARISDRATEASLSTVEDFRGRGLAAKVTAKWIGEVLKQGRIPLYSTSWDNLNSQRVAQKLGLHPYGMDFNITVE